MNAKELKKNYTQKEDSDLLKILLDSEDYNPETLEVIEEILSERGGREKVEAEVET